MLNVIVLVTDKTLQLHECCVIVGRCSVEEVFLIPLTHVNDADSFSFGQLSPKTVEFSVNMTKRVSEP